MDPPRSRSARRTSAAGGRAAPRTITSVQNWKSRSRATSVCAAAFGTRRSTAPSATCPSSIRRFTPSRSRTKPLAPASTTPAALRAARRSGVRESATSARRTRRRMNTLRSLSFRASRASSAASRATVRMVPSTGSSTAPSRRSNPAPMARARSPAEARSRAPSPSLRPSRNWERSIPELPRAPRIEAWAIASVTEGRGASASMSRRARATSRRVRHMLVPVSPSGTGNTFIRFSSSRPAATQSAAARSERRKRGPSRYAMPTVTGRRLLLLHHHGDLGAHVGVELHPDLELAQGANRLGEIDLALVHLDPALLEAALDVARGDRAVELVLLADLGGEGEAHRGELRGFAFGLRLLGGADLGDARGLE